MSGESVKALYFKENNIGNWMKKSKKQYIWKMKVDGETHHIEFLDSVLSGKKKIMKNGMVVFERQLFGVPFQYPFTIGKHSFNIAMHGDRYELRVDGNSFSHMYNLTKNKTQMEEYEENDMGAYGESSPTKDSYASRQKKYDDYDENPPSKNKNDDPFAWGEKPTAKFNSREPRRDDPVDTGYDGWNDVQGSNGINKSKIPDPYANSKYTSQYDPYPGDANFSNKISKSRGKGGTVVKKGNDFFSGGYNKEAPKKAKFDEKEQPKTFDFGEFGDSVDKVTKPGDDFENVFNDVPSKVQKVEKDDPFAWGNKISKEKDGQEKGDFDFDFNTGKTNETKTSKFDPFAVEENPTPVSSDPIEALADVKFESDPLPQAEFSTNPVFETEEKPKEKEDNKDPNDLWSENKLFDLSNLKKNKSNKEENKKEETKGIESDTLKTNGLSSQGIQNLHSPTKILETKEDKLNALENAFGSVETDAVATNLPQNIGNPSVNDTNFNQVPPTAPQNTTNAIKNDFGEFPSMFESNPDGFGTFKGFENDAFGGGNTAPPAPQTNNTDAFGVPQPAKTEVKNEKKDDWFEF